jgi:hypothetical protein
MDKDKSYNWISNIINTCNNQFHFEAVDKLIELFYQKYADGNLRTELDIQRNNKWNEIHNILQ